jgi:uncharacterized protein involved in exopolysaccharide biosynthesis
MRSSVSDHVLPENSQFAQLGRLVRSLGEELASYRKRALSAEARLKTVEGDAARVSGTSPKRVLELERENAELNRRLTVARGRTEKMLARVRFLKQQKDGTA